MPLKYKTKISQRGKNKDENCQQGFGTTASFAMPIALNAYLLKLVATSGVECLCCGVAAAYADGKGCVGGDKGCQCGF